MLKAKFLWDKWALFLVLFLYLINSIVVAKYGGGAGEPDDPYLIYNVDQFNNLSSEPNDWDKNFKLMADIDLDPNLPGRKLFDKAVFVQYSGSFDGNNSTIHNLTIDGNDCLGLFGRLEPKATVRNLGLVNLSVTGIDHVGGLACYNEGLIECCYSTGAVRSSAGAGGLIEYNGGTVTNSSCNCTVVGGSIVGGLVAENAGIVSKCYSEGTVLGDDVVGGLIGHNNLGRVDNCYSRGTVECYNTVGGLIAVSSGGDVQYCYSAGRVMNEPEDSDSPEDWIGSGGLIGYNEEGTVHNSFWDVEASGQSNSAGGTGLNSSQMHTASTFQNAGWDFVGEIMNGTDDIWWIADGWDYPCFDWSLVLIDDFEDGNPLPLWQVFQPEPDKIWTEETNGRLEVLTTYLADDIDAGYISNGWKLDVTKDFSLKVNFHYSKISSSDAWVLVMLLPSLEEPINRYIEIEAGCSEDQPFYLHEAIDSSYYYEEQTSRFTENGTLYVSYNADKDEVYLSFTGYGKKHAWQTAKGFLRGRWDAKPVYVAIGGGSDNVVFQPGQAYLDNFIINSGLVRYFEQ